MLRVVGGDDAAAKAFSGVAGLQAAFVTSPAQVVFPGVDHDGPVWYGDLEGWNHSGSA